MNKQDVYCWVTVGLVVTTEEPDMESAALKVEHMFQRGELTDRIIRTVCEENASLEIDHVEELYD